VIVYGKESGAPVQIDYQIIPEVDVFWISIYGGVAVALVAGCTGLCVLTGVSNIARYRITDVTGESNTL
jgi:hypothetical protein